MTPGVLSSTQIRPAKIFRTSQVTSSQVSVSQNGPREIPGELAIGETCTTKIGTCKVAIVETSSFCTAEVSIAKVGKAKFAIQRGSTEICTLEVGTVKVYA